MVALLTGTHWQWLDTIDPPRIEGLARLLNRVLEVDDTVGFPGPIPHEQALEVVGDLAREVASKRSYVLISESTTDAGTEVTGQCVLVTNRWPNTRHIGWVFRTMIDPRHRGGLILMRGMTMLADKSAELDLAMLCIDVRRGVAAEALWTRLGFKVFGVLPDYARVRGGSFEGAYMYQSVDDLRTR